MKQNKITMVKLFKMQRPSPNLIYHPYLPILRCFYIYASFLFGQFNQIG
jgi:hypothetical protein